MGVVARAPDGFTRFARRRKKGGVASSPQVLKHLLRAYTKRCMEADPVAATQEDANVTRDANLLSPLRGQDSSVRGAIEFRQAGASRILLAFGVIAPNVAPGPPDPEREAREYRDARRLPHRA